MRNRLAKLASTSAKLRSGIEKQAILGAIAAGLGRAALAGGKAVGSYAVRNPLKAGMMGLTGALGTSGAVGVYRQNKAAYTPALREAMLGRPPVPPGEER
jgi:hypothetical protein